MSNKVNRLSEENCNKTMCKTCIFRTDGNQLELAPGRMDQIKQYLLGESSHICHTTNLTCYGALTWQAEMYHRLGFIDEPTVDCFLKKAKQLLNL